MELSLTPVGATLFPSIEPFRKGLLELDHGHRMYWQLSGNPNGVPVLWIHGGPGSSAIPTHRRLLDPDRFFIIQYDQRGCGLSEPKGATHANTTPDLVADIERLRRALGLVRWHVVGSSWGSALALIYAQAHADRVARVLLRSPFLCTSQEIDGFVYVPRSGCETAWARLESECRPTQPSQNQTTSILEYSYRTLCKGDDVDAQSRLALAWLNYEASMDAWPAPVLSTSRSDGHALIPRYQVHVHYLKHRCFVDQTILANADQLGAVDMTLVHGDLDALCPFDNSLAIQRAVPQARLVPVAGAGHNMFDERMMHALLTELQTWA